MIPAIENLPRIRLGFYHLNFISDIHVFGPPIFLGGPYHKRGRWALCLRFSHER